MAFLGIRLLYWGIAVVVIIILALVLIFNGLIVMRNRVKNAWSQIDVQLQKRNDLVPNLVETVKGYAKHEKTAFENVAFALEAAGRPDEDISSDVAHVLDLVGLSDKIWNFPHELSGGEKQRVAIARAIVTRPDLVIADEPTGNLDPLNTRDIIRLLEKINDLGTTVLLATHDKEIIDSLERRVVTLDKGRVVRDEQRGRYVL